MWSVWTLFIAADPSLLPNFLFFPNISTSLLTLSLQNA